MGSLELPEVLLDAVVGVVSAGLGVAARGGEGRDEAVDMLLLVSGLTVSACSYDLKGRAGMLRLYSAV